MVGGRAAMVGEDRLREFESAVKRLRDLRIASLEEMWIEYDKQNDILYINFGKEEPDESIMLEDNVEVSIKGDRIVGIAVYEFSKRVGL